MGLRTRLWYLARPAVWWWRGHGFQTDVSWVAIHFAIFGSPPRQKRRTKSVKSHIEEIEAEASRAARRVLAREDG